MAGKHTCALKLKIPAKSDANLVKHGIDFVDAQTLWSDPDLLEIPLYEDRNL